MVMDVAEGKTKVLKFVLLLLFVFFGLLNKKNKLIWGCKIHIVVF